MYEYYDSIQNRYLALDLGVPPSCARGRAICYNGEAFMSTVTNKCATNNSSFLRAFRFYASRERQFSTITGSL
jgi:hypothetical protein